MKLGGCVVLYNPGRDVISNIASYLPFLEKLVVVDNSKLRLPIVDEIASIPIVEVISMGGNKGIASALNAGCRRLIEEGFTCALTMDQDSVFPLECAQEILGQIERHLVRYSLVGLNFNSEQGTDPTEIVETRYWLTSGNFIDLKAFEVVGGFNEALFIDYVDIEFGHRLMQAGLKECYLKNFSLRHSIGDPIEIRLAGKTFYAMNHSPIRYYYRYRNSRYLHGLDRAFYRSKYLRELFINIPKMLLFERERAAKLKMIRRGLMDGRAGVLGPYEEIAS